MKHLFTLFAWMITSVAVAQNLGESQSIDYDVTQDNYYYSSYYSNRLSTIKPGGTPYQLATLSQPSAVLLIDTIVYVVTDNYTKLVGINKNTGLQVSSKSHLIYSFHGMCSVNDEFIYLIDYVNKVVIKYELQTNQFSVVCNLNNEPSAIEFDKETQKVLVATKTINGVNILEIDLNNVVTTKFTTTDYEVVFGITIDENHNYYLATHRFDSSTVIIYDSLFTAAPLRELYIGFGVYTMDIYYNVYTDTLAIPNFQSPEIIFMGFDKPKAKNYFINGSTLIGLDICVLNNDSLSNNTISYLENITTPTLGNATQNGNCINYTSSLTGVDTIWYTICTEEYPRFCSQGEIIISVVDTLVNTWPIAYDDTAHAIQLVPISVNVVANDLDFNSDSLCVVAIIGNPKFSLDTLSCQNIAYQPDTFPVGFDSCLYVVCDNGVPSLCDTAQLVVKIGNNSAFKPVADFIFDFNNFTCYSLTTINTTPNTIGVPEWYFVRDNYPGMTLYGDTAYYLSINGFFIGQVCLMVSNPFGRDTICKPLNLICEGLADQPGGQFILTVSPNPTSNFLTITPKENQRTGFSTYNKSFIIYDSVGQQVKKVASSYKNENQTIDVSDLANGMYLLVVKNQTNVLISRASFVVSK
jgi:hypothetical protein